MFSKFIGKDEAVVEDWVVRQRLDKLVDVFKGMFFLKSGSFYSMINKKKTVEVLEGEDLGAFVLNLRPDSGEFILLMCPHPGEFSHFLKKKC